MRRRLVATYIALALVVLLALAIPLGIELARTQRRELASDVERDAFALASLLEDRVPPHGSRDVAVIRALARAYAQDSGTRVVVLGSGGRALVDTAPAEPGERSFASRPEIVQALRGIVAQGSRPSHTLRQTLLYVAVPIASGGNVRGAVRLSYPTATADARARRAWETLGAIGAVVLLIAVLMGVVLARIVRRPLESLAASATALGDGDLTVRSEVAGPPETRALATAFNLMASRLDDLVRAQQSFAADAAHELRTPLQALRLRLDTLEGEIAPDGRRDLEAAYAEALRLTRLVSGLLELARAEDAAQPDVAIELAPAVISGVERWRELGSDAGIALAVSVPPGLRVRAASDRVGQILDNLLANAFAASPEGSTIDVMARRVADRVELRVSDQGPGLSQEHKARAFDRFWRGHESGGGSGLGLAIVRRLVERDGGSLELSDAPGGGLEVVVRLPT
jgi:signal transduction histidine kinase